MNSPIAEKGTLSKFLDEVSKAPMMPEPDYDGVPYIETGKDVIDYYLKNPNAQKAFKDVGYFIFHNVRIYETGTRQNFLDKMAKEEEERIRGVRL